MAFYDIISKGFPVIDQIDIRYIGDYYDNITFVSSNSYNINGFIITCDDLPQNSAYIGLVCGLHVANN